MQESEELLFLKKKKQKNFCSRATGGETSTATNTVRLGRRPPQHPSCRRKPASTPCRPRHLPAGAAKTPARETPPNGPKFFASFFQKRSASFLASS
jgi:hypothetical protein